MSVSLNGNTECLKVSGVESPDTASVWHHTISAKVSVTDRHSENTLEDCPLAMAFDQNIIGMD